MTFAYDIKKALKEVKYLPIDPFTYCKNGFSYKKIRIFLSNVPIYDYKDDSITFIPSQTSDIILGHISPIDFLNWKNDRVEIILDNQSYKNCPKKYVNFEDLHIVRKDFYVKDLLSISKIKPAQFSNIDMIEQKVNYCLNERKKKDFRMSHFFTFSKEKLIKNQIEQVILAYTCASKELIDDFSIYRPQIYSVLDACKVLLNQKEIDYDYESNIKPVENNSVTSKRKYSEVVKNKYKGVIYQVETGEGKSCIISLIAAVLALNGKTVHIASSNYKLANRDYQNSFDFFKLLDLKSAVLLHLNEVPIPPKVISSKQKADKRKKEKEKTDQEKSKRHRANDKDYQKQPDINVDEDEFFGRNMDNYYKTNTQDDETEYFKYYNDKDLNYYGSEKFKNPSNMNFITCGLEENATSSTKYPNIVFSTFVNFECFYLKMVEKTPGHINDYYKNYALLIDEADSMLIDEIANGTIISREMKSNSTDVLKSVYCYKKNNRSEVDTYKMIKENWPECTDITLEDVKRMYSEINKIMQDEFTDGKKYSIEVRNVSNEKKKKKLNNRLVNHLSRKSKKSDIENENENEEEEETNDTDDKVNSDNSDDDIDEKDIDATTTVYREIVPFDYDHKGILEPNKEFNGFIQQFIAIKESEKEENKNMLIKNMSISYLYISHPIFVKLYGKVCGFTGTIGKKKEKSMYMDNYNLVTMKVPRNGVNYRVEFPMILCKDIDERNRMIVYEVCKFHQRKNPVLVIFQNLREIEVVSYLLHQRKIENINILDGKNEFISPEKVAGLNEAVSLGTNVCGRGANITTKGLPLHLIITYYTSNVRVLNQARGRTARQGRNGTLRIICELNQFLYPTDFNDSDIEMAVEEFRFKSDLQEEYVKYFMDTRPWIFDSHLKNQELSKEDIKVMRSAEINVNRLIAYNFEFPLIMSYKTFLRIQAQKIFSLLNCPNCKYTWMLFQQYIREMIFESYSLMLKQVDQSFFEREENKEFFKENQELKLIVASANSEEIIRKKQKFSIKFLNNIDKYKKKLIKSKNALLTKLKKYLPDGPKDVDIVPTFMHIFNLVEEKYKTVLFQNKEKKNINKVFKKSGFMSCKIGFKPYSLKSESGARINYKNFRKTNYIKDPELTYMKKDKRKKKFRISITEKIDDIFNKIFQKINEILGRYTNLRFYMRRTLCGCEFGVCLDITGYNDNTIDPNCIVDKDFMFVFAISVRNCKPLLAGILIIIAVYVASLTKNIVEWILFGLPKLTKEIVIKVLAIIINLATENIITNSLKTIIKYLRQKLDKQLKELHKKDTTKRATEIINILLKIFDLPPEEMKKKFCDYLCENLRFKFKFSTNVNLSSLILKISFLLLLCLATFIMNFNFHKNAITYEKEDAEEFTNSFEDKNKSSPQTTLNNLIEKREKYFDKKNKKKGRQEEKIDEETEDVFQSGILNTLLSFKYRFQVFDPFEYKIKPSKFILDPKPFMDISNISATVKYLIKKRKSSIKCIRMRYSGIKKVFMQQVFIYSNYQYPSILKMIGYYTDELYQDLYLRISKKSIGVLKNVIDNPALFKNIDSTKKLIIAYGIACAMFHLHKNHIVHRNLNTSCVFLDENYYPYLFDFYNSKEIQTDVPYTLTFATTESMSPEFLKDYEGNQNSEKNDVFSYGMLLYNLLFDNLSSKFSPDEIKNRIENRQFWEFPEINVDKEWENLILKCWETPDKRFNFLQIYERLRTKKFLNSIIDKKSFIYYNDKILHEKEIEIEESDQEELKMKFFI